MTNAASPHLYTQDQETKNLTRKNFELARTLAAAQRRIEELEKRVRELESQLGSK